MPSLADGWDLGGYQPDRGTDRWIFIEVETSQHSQIEIATVVPGYEEGGGLPAVADFLSTALERIGGFKTRIVSPLMRWNDPLNACLTRPGRWFRGPRAEDSFVQGRNITRVGTWWAELEFMRYCPRRALDRAVKGADLVQVVCGSAVSAYALRRVRQPLFIQVATTLSVERVQGRRPGSRPGIAWAMTRLCEPLERAALRRADGVFVENQWMYDRLASVLPKGRLHFAPPGVDTDFFRPDPVVVRDRLLFVGRLSDPRKNVRLLLEAYRRLCERLPAVPVLALAGSLPLSEDDARFVAESGLASQVELHLRPDRVAVAALYRRCQIFLLGSNEEGFGIVLTEAMSSGAPVVSTDCGGPRVIVEEGHTGFLVPIGDTAAMADRVARLLQDETLRHTMGVAARAWVNANFSIAVCGRRFADAYRAALPRN